MTDKEFFTENDWISSSYYQDFLTESKQMKSEGELRHCFEKCLKKHFKNELAYMNAHALDDIRDLIKETVEKRSFEMNQNNSDSENQIEKYYAKAKDILDKRESEIMQAILETRVEPGMEGTGFTTREKINEHLKKQNTELEKQYQKTKQETLGLR